MFKNISIFTITANEPSAEPMQEFVPCGPTQALSYGWVPPRGVAHGPLAESINEQMIANLIESLDGRWTLQQGEHAA